GRCRRSPDEALPSQAVRWRSLSWYCRAPRTPARVHEGRSVRNYAALVAKRPAAQLARYDSTRKPPRNHKRNPAECDHIHLRGFALFGWVGLPFRTALLGCLPTAGSVAYFSVIYISFVRVIARISYPSIAMSTRMIVTPSAVLS